MGMRFCQRILYLDASVAKVSYVYFEVTAENHSGIVGTFSTIGKTLRVVVCGICRTTTTNSRRLIFFLTLCLC
jgi:hypothetical protein